MSEVETKGRAPRGYASSKRDRRRAEIVAVATREMNEHGVQGLVLAEVAAKVGMTKANLTYYFRRKDDLAAVCIDQTLGEYRLMIAAASDRETARARFEALFTAFFARAAQAAAGQVPPLAGLGALPALDEPFGTQAIERYRDLLQATGALFQAPDGPALDRVGRVIRAQIVLTQLFWFSTWIDQYDPGDYPRIARRLFDVVADGILPCEGLDAHWQVALPEPNESDPQRAAFYQAATRLINRLGYRGASVDRIGAAASLTKGSVYHHHPSKEEVVLACSDRSFRAMWSIIRAVEAAGGDVTRRLAALVQALVVFQASDQGPFLRASALSALPAGPRERVSLQWGRVTHHLAALVSDGVADGVLRPVDPVIAAQVIAAAVNAADEIHRFAPDLLVDVAALCAIPTLNGIFTDDPAVAARRAGQSAAGG